jgi:hypothetical protein
VFFLILLILLRVPIESGLCHRQSLARIGWNSHTFIWLQLARFSTSNETKLTGLR